MKSPKITIKQTTDKEVPVEVLADAIIAISAGIKKLRTSRLTDRALMLLIQDAAPADPRYGGVTQRDIKAVLAGIEGLEAAYIKKKPAK